jgi:hypothetical protein
MHRNTSIFKGAVRHTSSLQENVFLDMLSFVTANISIIHYEPFNSAFIPKSCVMSQEYYKKCSLRDEKW